MAKSDAKSVQEAADAAAAAVGEYKWGFHDTETPLYQADKGLNAGIVNDISSMKNEPKWMLDKRMQALEIFRESKNPKWPGGSDLLGEIDFDNIRYYVKACLLYTSPSPRD